MNELLAAAKAVIDRWDLSKMYVESPIMDELRAAVDRAEKQEAVGFDDYWHSEKFRWDRNLKRDVQAVWNAAQQAERERIRARVKLAAERTWKAGDWYIGPQHNMIEKFIEELLRDDSDE